MLDIFKLKFEKHLEAEDEQKSAENLQFLEEVLKEEDPEFMKNMGDIDIENSAVDDSLPDQSTAQAATGFSKFYGSLFSSRLMQSPFFGLLVKPLMVHKYPKQAIGFWIVFAGLGFGIFKSC